MTISILTLFPDMFRGPFDFSIIKRAQTPKNLLSLNLINIRDFANDNYGTVDDRPYGGGVGMIMRVDVIDRALKRVKSQFKGLSNTYTILLDTRGVTYTQALARKFCDFDHLILVCGHYEGVDYRVNKLVDSVISIGDYVLTGGEIPALVLVDSITRLLPGVLSKASATTDESFTNQSLEYPQFTRPETYKNMTVPAVLRSGDPRQISIWKKVEAQRLTKAKKL